MAASQRLLALSSILALTALAACVPRTPPPAAQPPLPPPPLPVPPPPAATAPPAIGWEDADFAAGDWSYAGGGADAEARFGVPGTPLLVLRCLAGQRIAILRPGAAAGPMTVATSFGERTVAAAAEGDGALAALAASDPLFDEIAFSRGRFLVRASGAADLVLPAWPEPARVIEDCRG